MFQIVYLVKIIKKKADKIPSDHFYLLPACLCDQSSGLTNELQWEKAQMFSA